MSFNKIFRIISYSSNPLEININTKILNQTFEYVIASGLFEIILRIIINQETPLEVKFEALKALSLMTYCFKLKTADFDGNAFLNNSQIKSNLFHFEFLQILVSAASCDWVEIRYQATLCLAFIAELDGDALSVLIKMEIVQLLSPFITQEKPDVPNVEAIGLLFSCMATSISFSFNNLPDKNFLMALVEAGYNLINTQDHLGILKTGFSILGPVLHALGVS